VNANGDEEEDRTVEKHLDGVYENKWDSLWSSMLRKRKGII